jgi:DNA-directed RNA polymerase, mitochondrial
MLDNALPVELERAWERFEIQQDRIVRDQGWGDTALARTIAQEHIVVLRDAIRSHLDAKDADDMALMVLLRDLEPEVIALCILQMALHSIATGCTYRKMSHNIGEAIAGECWAAGLLKDNPRKIVSIQKKIIKQHGNIKRRQKAIHKWARTHGYKQRTWGIEMYVRAGSWGLKVLTETFPDVFLWERQRNLEMMLVVAPEVMEKAHQIVSGAIVNRPVWMPLSTPPVPWTNPHDGGSPDPRMAGRQNLVRSRFKDVHSAVREAIKDGTMRPTLDAVNALQAVPWSINEPVLEVMKACVERGIEVSSLPGQKIPFPPKPQDGATEAQMRAWSFNVGRAKEANRALTGSHTSLNEDLTVATQLAQWGRFWVPMNLDWRSRVYGMSHFDFQREDRVRALFLFADGEPIGIEGIYWLKVHLANSWDGPEKLSKQPFDQRVAWVNSNIEKLKDYAWTPLFNLGWTKAEAPFQFLGACIELSAALEHGPSYVTRLPISFDGSCSGLQHLCAMTRAPEGCLVNLTPSSIPQDVYQTVADEVTARMTLDLQHEETRQQAQLCLEYGMTRKVVKRNVMTYCYSSKQYGMAEQQREDLMRPLALEVLEGKIEEHPFGPNEGYHLAKYLAKHIYAAIEEVVDRPAQAMAFLQKLSKALSHECKPLRWTTPAGFPWVNRYHEPVVKHIKLWMHDQGVKVPYTTRVFVGDQKPINKKRAANGVAPNFVHACDAAHLFRVVNASANEGIVALATVHDSFGCLASQAGRFRSIIREQFVAMYEQHDVLAEVLAQANADLIQHNPHRVPQIPQYGSLDLKEVLNAEYAFS